MTDSASKPAVEEAAAKHSTANSVASSEVTADQIAPERTEITEDKLSKLEGSSPETRGQRLANDLVEQRHRLQRGVFGVVIVAICVFYIVFLLMVIHLVCGGAMAKGFPVTATVLVGMLGSIPTILSVCLVLGLFSSKEYKDRDEKASDWNALVKGVIEILKFIKSPSSGQ